ncbi:procathepsin L-like [Gigantopelta aegis]|uniref:procathepsin L-like n=1 Tax=Gigantopelta aegis TaxID=1735272 RepID=UPI001B88E662|nr:procathepsin L-like [Gigantopelta aegis]
MLRLVILGLLASVAFSFRTELDGEWEIFKKTYSKHYDTTSEFIRRFVWESNVAYIQQHNLEADRNLHTYRLGVNEYTDLTNAEFNRMMNGYRMSETPSEAETFVATETNDLPTEVDWRTKGYVTPIKNQKQCGSCWAFSSTGSLEGQHFKKSGTLTSLSEQNLVDCSRKEGNMGCGGGLMDYAFTYIKKNKGIDTETSYPYKARNERCHFKREDVGATDVGFVDIERGSESSLMQAVATVGPIAVAIDASNPSFQSYKSGVYSERSCSSTRLDHGVLAVGYGTHEGDKYWLVKNSWGESWGMKGYIMMSKDKDNQCGIATSASYPKV